MSAIKCHRQHRSRSRSTSVNRSRGPTINSEPSTLSTKPRPSSSQVKSQHALGSVMPGSGTSASEGLALIDVLVRGEGRIGLGRQQGRLVARDPPRDGLGRAVLARARSFQIGPYGLDVRLLLFLNRAMGAIGPLGGAIGANSSRCPLWPL